MIPDWFITAVQNNEIMQAALVAAPATALTYAARNIPGRIWNGLKHMVTYDLVFRSDQEEYYFVNKMVCDDIVNPKWSRDFAYDNIELWDNENAKPEQVYLGMSIGYGRHWGSYKGHPVIVHRELEKDNQTSEFKETLSMSFMGRTNAPARMFCDEVAAAMKARKAEDQIKLRRSSGGGWAVHGTLSPRPMSSVFTNGTIKEDLLAHVRAFEESRGECLHKGLPWRTGALLKGPPGTGKTSLIHAIASETGRDINFLNLSGVRDDGEVADLIGSRGNWMKAILVIEDIDAAKANVSRESDTDGVSLSSLLNILDGFLTPEGMVTFATTNHPERLDPALVRSGRFDFVAELGPLEWEQAEEMAVLLLGENNQFGEYREFYQPKVGSDLRQAMLDGTLNKLFSI